MNQFYQKIHLKLTLKLWKGLKGMWDKDMSIFGKYRQE